VVGGGDVAPRDADGEARPVAEGHDFSAPRDRHAPDPAALPDRPAPREPLDHRLRGARAGAAAERGERELEAHRAGKRFRQRRGQAVAGHDVEAARRQERHAARPGFRIAREGRFDDRDLAGDVEIVRAHVEARPDDGPAGLGEGSRREEDRAGALDAGQERPLVVEGKSAPREPQRLGHLPHRILPAAGENGLFPARGGLGGDQAAGIAVGAVEEPAAIVPALPRGTAHSAASSRKRAA